MEINIKEDGFLINSMEKVDIHLINMKYYKDSFKKENICLINKLIMNFNKKLKHHPTNLLNKIVEVKYTILMVIILLKKIYQCLM